MTFEMPLFPLNVVLFPGMPLPLHIFEPRYRLMMRRVLDSDRTFGIALMTEGEEGSAGTVPAPIGCAAHVLEVAPFPDGRMNIQAIGQRRFRVLSTREEDEYLIGTVEWLDDETPQLSGEMRALTKQVRRALYDYLLLLARDQRDLNPDNIAAGTDELSTRLAEAPREPFELSMWVAALLLLPNEQKQALLEATSTLNRLQLELDLLRRAQVVHRAFAQRALWLQSHPPQEESNGPFAQFLSPN